MKNIYGKIGAASCATVLFGLLGVGYARVVEEASRVEGADWSSISDCGRTMVPFLLSTAPADYVEARDATVWGGACHISSQMATGGKSLVQAWSFDTGGASLRAVLVTEGDSNLDAHAVFDAGAPASRRAALWFDAPATVADENVKRALAQHLSGAQADALAGAAVRRAPIRFEREGDDFDVAIAGVLTLKGSAMADRECCTMPEARWYQPLATISESVVANVATCRFEGDKAVGLGAWTHEGENSAYVGRFGS